MLEYLKNKKILVVVAHPDDEILGLGATVNRLIEDYGCDIMPLVLGEGITSRAAPRDKKKWSAELEKHRINVKIAQGIIGYSDGKLYDLPDNRFDSVDLLDIIKIVESEKNLFKPEVIITHHGGDLNIDHRRTFEAVITATRPLSTEVVKTILTFETPSATEWRASNQPFQFSPNVFIEISQENLNVKITAMESYEFERRKYPHPRSPESLEILAKRNGIMVGKVFAEAFQLVRCVI